MEARSGRRPLAAHRFLIELELVTAGDIDQDSLVSTLTQLSTAGLHGMVSEVRRVVLDGTEHVSTPDIVPPATVQRVRPPVDPKVKRIARELEEIADVLRSLGVTLEVVPLRDAG